MKTASDCTRRNFIKTSAAAGGTLLLSGILPDQEARAATTTQPTTKPQADTLLKGICDIHVHAAPDTRPRSISELSFVREAKEAGYRAVMFKSNDWSCHDRAYIIREAVPDFECFGSLIMNQVHGGTINVHAAEQAIKTTGNYCRCIWMPTMAAAYHHQCDKRQGKGIPVLADNGTVLPDVIRVMEICAEADIIFASGHCSPEESIILAKKAQEVGVKKFVVTHANSHIWKMTHDQIKRSLDYGAFIEYSYITNVWGPGTGIPQYEPLSDAEFVAFARIAPKQSIITTDLGQVNMPHPLEGMRKCLAALQKGGITQQEIDLMVRTNPAKLVGLDT